MSRSSYEDNRYGHVSVPLAIKTPIDNVVRRRQRTRLKFSGFVRSAAKRRKCHGGIVAPTCGAHDAATFVIVTSKPVSFSSSSRIT